MTSRAMIVMASAALFACHGRLPETAPGTAPASLTPMFEAIFTRSAADWNAGRLDAFVSDYAHDSTTTFVSGGHLHFGYDWIRSNYAPLFQPGARRDSLRFEEMYSRELSPTLAQVFGRYILFRDGKTTSSGPFTLIMQRQGTAWKILHDQSGSDTR